MPGLESGSNDIVVVGGGVLGLAAARSILLRQPRAKVVVLEKETNLAAHASGRNSGVMHAGIYYDSGTLKSRFSAAGVAAWREFCREHALPWVDTGKLIVATSEAEVVGLAKLEAKAAANNVVVTRFDAKQIREMEPHAEGRYGALYSPRTAGVDPVACVKALAEEVKKRGAEIRLGVGALGADPARGLLFTSSGTVPFGKLLNAAGAHADRVASWFGAGTRYATFPFRGAYWELSPASSLRIKGNIYPVPNPELPFLGVHFTRAVSGRIYVGPTAMPAMGREHYEGFSGIEIGGLLPFARLLIEQFIRNKQGFRRHVANEGRILLKSKFVAAAQRLVPEVRESDLIPCKKRGIRAQLFDLEERRLVHDFLVEDAEKSLHVLNGISPGFTCALAFAEHVTERLLR